MIAARDGASAEAELRRALASGAPLPSLAPFLGEAELLQGNLVEAERWLGPGEFSPDVAAHGFRMLGRLRMSQGDLPAAGLAFDRAFSSGPESAEQWVDVGRLRWRGGEQVQAVDAAKRALRLEPDNSAAIVFRTQLLRDSTGNSAALRLIERGLASAPTDPDLLAEHAATLGELGRASDMLAATRKLAEVAPDEHRHFYLQAVLAARAGRTDLARALIQRGGENVSNLPGSKLIFALTDMEDGNYASAAQELDALSRQQPDNLRIRHLLGRALLMSGNHRELVARFETRATTPYLAMLVGRSYEALGDPAKAAPYLDSANAGSAMRLSRIGSIATTSAEKRTGANIVEQVRRQIGEGKERRALDDALRFLAGNPGSGDAASLAGDASLAAGDARSALQFYRRAAEIRRPWSLVKRMTVAFDLAGQPAEGTALISQHLRNEPANADAAAMLARRLFDLDEKRKAASLIEFARALGRNDPIFIDLVAG